jgi:predicted O-linked N-acetylglucosamine transferase (SPINDLY family)
MATISAALATAIQDHQAGRLQAAEQIYRQILAVEPNQADAWHLLGVVSAQLGQHQAGIEHIRQALALRPNWAEAQNNLGNALRERGQLAEAVVCCQRAVQLKPDFVEAHNSLGVAFAKQGKPDEAAARFQQALELDPRFAKAHCNLGNVFRDQGKLDEAVACFRQALELQPDFAEADYNLGNAFKDQGQPDEAVACYRRVLELRPDFAAAHSNLLYTLNFCALGPGCDARTIYEEHRRWDQEHAQPLANFIAPHANDRSPDRRLRIGYVSPNFRSHPVGIFLLPLLESHDHRDFEVYCYADVVRPDAMTAGLRGCADVWRDIVGLADDHVAHLVRQDRIDILVDLTLHMDHNRLLVFARKPAPVQVTYLAYCGTTGLGAMDYRLTDPFLDPPGEDRQIYSEESICLPESYWCYRPPIETPPGNALPALEAGHISFGSLNNFCKVTAAVLVTWSRILLAVPGSCLLLHAHSGGHRNRVRSFFVDQGIASERLTFAGFLPTAEYFALYRQIDVALDPFPYGGGTTTCDALWMGVPLVSLAGATAVGRSGLSILSNLGLGELVAHDSEEYVRIAVELSSDLPRLSELRATLRQRMQRSALMDAPRFARNIEAAYRTMWQRWCGAEPVEL